MLRTIFQTPECSAWSKGFDYENYLELHALCKEVHSYPVHKEVYRTLCKAFELQMRIDICKD
jgi:hypothetical protein